MAGIVGGATSSALGGDFAAGAFSASFARLFNDEKKGHGLNEDAQKGRQAQRRAQRNVSVSTSVDEATGEHLYQIRGRICSTSSSACNQALADRVFGRVNANDIPFTSDNLGSGERLLLGRDPIHHSENIAGRTSINTTLPGHTFHPGTVTHQVHFENGNLYYDVTGRGSGSLPGFNNFVGKELFQPNVVRTVRDFGF